MYSKIVYLDKNKHASTAQHSMAGPDMTYISNINNLPEKLKKLKPDLVFINKGDVFNDINLIKHITSNYRTAYWFGDWRTTMPKFMYDWARHSAITFFNGYDPALWNQLKSFGQNNVFVIHQGADPDVFKPIDNIKKKYDVGFGAHFYGSAFPNSTLRIQAVRELKSNGFNVAIAGNGWPSNIGSLGKKNSIELNGLYNQCRTTIGISHFTDVKYATSNRLYQCMAVGVPHIAWDCPGVKELFDEGYLGVNSIEEMIQVIKNLIDKKELREKIGNIQRSQILKYHTFEHAWKRIENKIKTIFPELK